MQYSQGKIKLERAEELFITFLKSEKIDVNIKDKFDRKAIDLCLEKTPFLRLLLECGHISAENAKDHVTRLQDEGDNHYKQKNY